MMRMTREDLEHGLRSDTASLDAVRRAIATLEAGGRVANLTLPNALRAHDALVRCIENKRALLAQSTR